MADQCIFKNMGKIKITKIRKDVWGGFRRVPGHVAKYRIIQIYEKGNYVIIEDRLK